MGDSITAGVGDAIGPDAPYGPGWAAHLAILAGASSFLNLASNGMRARDVAGSQLGTALAERPQIATMLVGGNDVLRSDFSVPEIARSLSTAVGAMQEAGAAVVLARLPAIRLFEHAPGRVARVMRGRMDAVNAVVDGVAARAAGVGGKVVVVDMGAAIAGTAVRPWHVDGVHPSPSGHRQLAISAARALSGAGVLALPSGAVEAPTGAEDPLWAALPTVGTPPSAVQRLIWLAVAGLPWCLRRGRDFVPGLLRAVVDAGRAAEAGMEEALSGSWLPRGVDEFLSGDFDVEAGPAFDARAAS